MHPSVRFRATAAVVMTAVLLLLLWVSTPIAGARKPAPPPGETVSVVTLTGGPVDTTVELEDVTIPLNGQETYTFTQRAGQVVQLVVYFDSWKSSGGDFCDLAEYVYDAATGIGTHAENSTNKGEVDFLGSSVVGFPAPAADRTIELRAVAREIGEYCDREVPGENDSGEDTWTVSVTVSLVLIGG